MSFWSRFKSTVHENEHLNAVDKFNYLKSVLNSDAERAISGLSLTEENYDKAIKILENRFGRKELIIDSHMNKLLDLPPVKRSCDAVGLRKLYDTCEVQMRGLESLGIQPDSYSCLLYPVLIKSIPPDLALDFNKKAAHQSETKITDLLDFLKAEVESRERTNQMTKCTGESAFRKPVPEEKLARIGGRSKPKVLSLSRL